LTRFWQSLGVLQCSKLRVILQIRLAFRGIFPWSSGANTWSRCCFWFYWCWVSPEANWGYDLQILSKKELHCAKN